MGFIFFGERPSNFRWRGLSKGGNTADSEGWNASLPHQRPGQPRWPRSPWGSKAEARTASHLHSHPITPMDLAARLRRVVCKSIRQDCAPLSPKQLHWAIADNSVFPFPLCREAPSRQKGSAPCRVTSANTQWPSIASRSVRNGWTAGEAPMPLTDKRRATNLAIKLPPISSNTTRRFSAERNRPCICASGIAAQHTLVQACAPRGGEVCFSR